MQQNLEASAKHGVDNLVYTFYDRGYSALNEGIQNLKNMSAALLVMRAAAAVILTLQISHIYITRQNRRLSIERLLGVTGKKCRDICLTGILILLLMRTVPGVAAGMAVSERVDIGDMGQEDFNRKYSNLGLMAKVEIDLSGQNQGNLAVSCMMGRLVLGVGISGVKARNILKREPLYLVEDERAGK
jgi:succinate dehydrogenase hydrophobic anchor subunit